MSLAQAERMNITDAIEKWIRWRVYRANSELGWPKRDSIGRALSGMPSTKCIVCNGKGRIIEHDADGRDIRIECRICAGQGKLAMDPDPNKANPAYIHSTRSRDSYDDDPTSQKIDHIVCTELSELERVVLLLGFGGNGTQYDQARKVRYTVKRKRGRNKKKRGITQAHFSRTLEAAISKIEEYLEFDTDVYLEA